MLLCLCIHPPGESTWERVWDCEGWGGLPSALKGLILLVRGLGGEFYGCFFFLLSFWALGRRHAQVKHSGKMRLLLWVGKESMPMCSTDLRTGRGVSGCLRLKVLNVDVSLVAQMLKSLLAAGT